jgi:hypothetical protein
MHGISSLLHAAAAISSKAFETSGSVNFLPRKGCAVKVLVVQIFGYNMQNCLLLQLFGAVNSEKDMRAEKNMFLKNRFFRLMLLINSNTYFSVYYFIH